MAIVDLRLTLHGRHHKRRHCSLHSLYRVVSHRASFSTEIFQPRPIFLPFSLSLSLSLSLSAPSPRRRSLSLARCSRISVGDFASLRRLLVFRSGSVVCVARLVPGSQGSVLMSGYPGVTQLADANPRK